MGSLISAPKSIQFRLRPTERRIILLIGDAVMASCALLVAMYIWSQQDWLGPSISKLIPERIPPWFFLLPVVWMVINIEMYDIRRAGHRGETVKGVLIAAAVCTMVYLVGYFIADPKTLPRRSVATFIVSAAVFMVSWRFIYIQVFTTPEFMRRVLVVGAGRAG